MSVKTVANLDAKIFDRERLKRALSGAVAATAKEFRQSTRFKMQSSPHTGAILKQTGGEGFSRAKRRSKRGERPQVITGNLSNAVTVKKTGEFSAVVFVDEARAPYGEILQEIGRVIMSAADAAEAEDNLNRRSSAALLNLL